MARQSVLRLLTRRVSSCCTLRQVTASQQFWSQAGDGAVCKELHGTLPAGHHGSRGITSLLNGLHRNDRWPLLTAFGSTREPASSTGCRPLYTGAAAGCSAPTLPPTNHQLNFIGFPNSEAPASLPRAFASGSEGAAVQRLGAAKARRKRSNKPQHAESAVEGDIEAPSHPTDTVVASDAPPSDVQVCGQVLSTLHDG